MDTILPVWVGINEKEFSMQNTIKVFGIIAMVAIIGFSFTACGAGNGNGETVHTHQWGAWTQATAPTCTTAGEETRVCSLDADHTETRTVDALGHDYGGWITQTTRTLTIVEKGVCSHDPSHTGTREIPHPETGVWLQAGTFTMGSPTDEPSRSNIAGKETQHTVTLTKGFYMGKHPVTQAQYEVVMGTNPSSFTTPVSPETNTEKRPVDMVRWYETLVFCNKLSVSEDLTPAYRISGSTDPATWGTVPTSNDATWNTVEIVAGSTGYRLPTEAQWEYACRAGTATPFNTGNNVTTAQANYNGSVYPYNGNPAGGNLGRTTEVGSYAANAWGLYDMHGNVYEWCWDRYATYANEAQTDPEGSVSVNNTDRVQRGGSYDSIAQYLRSAYREAEKNPSYRNGNVGFRIVRP
jgi:formylglycine-generating enzyme required for sulfatase activity